MFVRWKRKKLVHGEMLQAVLVRCVREGGKPRQKVVAYLASYNTGYPGRWRCHRSEAEDAAFRKRWFWHKVDEKVRELALDGDTAAWVVATLARVVPRPGGV
jgi:hypothetical protein